MTLDFEQTPAERQREFDMLDLRQAIFGKAGSGKTYAAIGEVETLLHLNRRVCVSDPLGVWWGLRSQQDGVGKGFDIAVLGGKHGDMQIDENMGSKIGKIVATNDFSCIIDLSLIRTKAGERLFMSQFLRSLYEHNTELLHLIMDEADTLAPQQLRPEKGEGNALQLFNLVDQIVRRGRVRGFIPWMISQRPAVLHKDVLSQAEMLVAMNLPSPQDRGAIEGWIKGQSDSDAGKAILADLPKLQTGEGYVWAPRYGVLEKRKFPPNATYDSSRTPVRGEKVKGITLPKIDLSAIAAALGGAEEGSAPGKGGAGGGQRQDKVALERARSEGFAAGAASRDVEVLALQKKVARQQEVIDTAGEMLMREKTYGITTSWKAPEATETMPKSDVPPIIQAEKPQKEAKKPDNPKTSPGDVSRHYGAEARMMDVLRTVHPEKLSETRWATLSVVKRTSSTWRNSKSRLKVNGLIEFAEGKFGLTATGAKGVEGGNKLNTRAVVAMWREALGGGATDRLFNALLATGPVWTPKDRLAKQIGVDPASSTWRNAVSKLRTNELIKVSGDQITLVASLLGGYDG